MGVTLVLALLSQRAGAVASSPKATQSEEYLAGFSLTMTPGETGEPLNGVLLKH